MTKRGEVKLFMPAGGSISKLNWFLSRNAEVQGTLYVGHLEMVDFYYYELGLMILYITIVDNN